jgi:hypothetical protein
MTTDASGMERRVTRLRLPEGAPLRGLAAGARFNAGQGEVLPMGNQSAPGCYENSERESDERNAHNPEYVKQITTLSARLRLL